MLIDAPLGFGKTDLTAEKYVELIASGAKTNEILVLCNNQPNRTRMLEKIREGLIKIGFKGGADLRVYTFNGVVRNTINNNWALFENLIPNDFGIPQVSPETGGMENALFLMNRCCERANFSDYRSGINLMHQMMRRYTLIVNNNLSKEEIKQKSQLLGETFFEDANTAIETFKKYTLKYRIFDYLRQGEAFSSLYKSGKIRDFDSIKHLLVNNIDEFTYLGFSFVESFFDNVDTIFITADSQGSSRMGYLCAYEEGVRKLKEKFEVKKFERNDKTFKNAQILYQNLTSDKINPLRNLEISSFIHKQEMIEGLTNIISELLKKCDENDITIAMSENDEITNYFLKKYFHQNNIKHHFLSGTKRIYDDKASFCAIILMILTEEKIYPLKVEIKKLLMELLNLPNNVSSKAADYFARQKKLPETIEVDEQSLDSYKKLLELLKSLKEKEISPTDKMLLLFKEVILPNLKDEDDFDKFKMLIKSLEEFETLKTRSRDDFRVSFCDWLAQMRINIVSDNPFSEENFDDAGIIISSPQKIIDYEIKSKYQIWFDTSSRSWIKEDTGTLYNAWVFQKDFTQSEYTIELHQQLTLKKNAALLRKLMLCCEDKVFLLNSTYDTLGNENKGELLKYLICEEKTPEKNKKQIVPREDQKPVLDYKKGKMAVAAVPGAGKTTIMLALIIKLIECGVKPTEILVLTYMESAASNFVSRIKSMTNIKDMPQISTIHGLAYKIIQEEDNCSRIGLSDNFEICDETRRLMIARPICISKLPAGEQLQDWIDYCLKNISKAKSLLLSAEAIFEHPSFAGDSQLKEFYEVYKEYSKSLKSNNMLDYDDLLIYSNELIEKYPDIRRYYQNKFKYIIEDEAQDSSLIQQKLINTLSEKHSNLVRCGDLNQAIMSTFTNADIDGFKKFIEENSTVEMQSSQRCGKEIYELANSFVKEFAHTKEFSDAFYSIEMIPVEGKNPQNKDAVEIREFETNREEMDFVTQKIKKLQKDYPDYTCAILFRTNRQLSTWMAYLENNGINTLSRTENLKNKKVFKLLFKFLEFLYSPSKNSVIQEFALILKENKIISAKKFHIEQIKKLNTAFMEEEPQDSELLELWWELYYWLENRFESEEEAIIKAGYHYFSKSEDLSNVNLFCSIVKNFKRSFRNYTQEEPTSKDVISHLNSLSNKPKLNGMRYFSEINDEKISLKNGVELMTVHKSKGDEFDVVFIVEMSEYNYSIDTSEIKINKQNALVPKLELIAGKKPKNEDEIKQEQANEALRLIYVGITRAKRGLCLSCYKKQKNFAKTNTPSFALKILSGLIEKEEPAKL